MDILIKAHGGFRWIVLILLLAAVVKMHLGWKGKKQFSAGDKKLALFAMISFHIQFLLGWILYFMSPKVNFGEQMMSLKLFRFFTIEHSLVMVIAMILITVGYSKSKKKTEDKSRFKTIAIFYTVALILVLSRIPWPFMEGLAVDGWF